MRDLGEGRESGGCGFDSRATDLGMKKMSSAGSRGEKTPPREAFSVLYTSCTSTIVASAQDKGSE